MDLSACKHAVKLDRTAPVAKQRFLFAAWREVVPVDRRIFWQLIARGVKVGLKRHRALACVHQKDPQLPLRIAKHTGPESRKLAAANVSHLGHRRRIVERQRPHKPAVGDEHFGDFVLVITEHLLEEGNLGCLFGIGQRETCVAGSQANAPDLRSLYEQ